MTDTSREAVERLASHIQSTCGCALGANADQPVAATLRALLARAEAAETRVKELERAFTDHTKTPHEWKPSSLGHGEFVCVHCHATNRELAVIGDLNHCPSRAALNPKGTDNAG